MKKYLFSQQDSGYIPPTSPSNFNTNQQAPRQGASGMAISSACAGILTLVGCWCCWMGFFGFIPVILGFIELSKIKSGASPQAGKVFCIIGIITGSIALLLTILLFILGLGMNLFQKLK